MSLDRPFLGIVLMLGFCLFAPLGDAVAKLLGQTVAIGLLLSFRFSIQALVLIPLIWMTNRPWRMQGRVLRLTIIRTLLHILGIGLMVTALQYLPLADAVAIAFVMPFIILLLGRFVLNEHVGRRRLGAAIVGFLGTLLVVQPSFAVVGWAALLPLGVAVNFAVLMLITRQIAKETDPISLQAVSGVMATLILVPALLIGTWKGFDMLTYSPPNSTEISLLLGIGVIGTVAHLLMTWSLRFAPSSTLAPMQYLEIPMAALLGWTVFGDWPDVLALWGIAITVSAGLFILLTEQTSAARALTPTPEPLG